ncbi:MAG: type IIA DNA topoisomerase subunit B [Deltaproteobacteria bacterium]|nr:type IIA DNA topoisomerase subunit B [Deltaproteobacteria bacterium]MBW2400907.1 type IIA DNA topoisomerase subunit B [Deltaproteobacteria bacterium]
MARTKVAYDEKAIQTLDALEHIRLRSGMYIGRLGDGSHPLDGIYVMLKEVIDNAVDEFIMGCGRRVEVERDGDSITVRDFGRGIPLGKLVDCVSQINTGGKYNDDVFQFSVGLNGVGSKAVNALSADFEVTSWRDGKSRKATFERGRLKTNKPGRDADATPGTRVRFTPDREIFSDFAWNEEFIAHRLNYYAFLNAGLTLHYNGTRFHSKGGLADLLAQEIGDDPPLYDPIHCRLERIEFAITHANSYGETYYSFVNGQYTNDGGTHQSAFREGFLKGVNEFAKQNFAGEDVRDGIIGAIALKLQDPVFDSQTKNKLGSTEVRAWVVPLVKDEIVLWLHKNPEAAERLVGKIKTNERIRKELASIKKEARERARKVAIRIPKLTDCKFHFDDAKAKRRSETSLFITEGDSAGGVMVQCRDVYTQAIFALKGKPLNCHGLKRDAIYKNEELYNLMRALGIEEGVEGLRYNKIVIATDADVDGMHIRNLLLTYFLRYFEDLVIKGHVYILETPLFRVRNKQVTRYCYSDVEKESAEAEIRGAEVTRFKGLGEISPNEFGQFIGDEGRLSPVSVQNISEVSHCLDFFMGKNTPERKAFIIDNLVTSVV